MSCPIFWTVRMIILAGSAIASLICIYTIIKNRLHNRLPIRYILHISVNHFIMTICATIFSIISISVGPTTMISYIDTTTNEFKDNNMAVLVLSRLEAFVYKSSELVHNSLTKLDIIRFHHAVHIQIILQHQRS
jgi:hypothetical protein